ncbi:hypothetical protein ACF0H5_015451 [Mactra antiquata]
MDNILCQELMVKELEKQNKQAIDGSNTTIIYGNYSSHENRTENYIQIVEMNVTLNGHLDENMTSPKAIIYVADDKAVADSANPVHGGRKELPLRIIIAGPTAAVSIAVFLCVAYYFHNAQLNKKAKRLSITLYVNPTVRANSATSAISVYNNPARRQSVPGLPRNQRSFQDFTSMPPSRKSIVSLHGMSGPPPNLYHKRISSFSMDQEILTLSAPRRHSTFII